MARFGPLRIFCRASHPRQEARYPIPIQQHDLLDLRRRFLARQQAQSLQAVEEQGLAATEVTLPVSMP